MFSNIVVNNKVKAQSAICPIIAEAQPKTMRFEGYWV
jgi:hypothetical protein